MQEGLLFGKRVPLDAPRDIKQRHAHLKGLAQGILDVQSFSKEAMLLAETGVQFKASDFEEASVLRVEVMPGEHIVFHNEFYVEELKPCISLATITFAHPLDIPKTHEAHSRIFTIGIGITQSDFKQLKAGQFFVSYVRNPSNQRDHMNLRSEPSYKGAIASAVSLMKGVPILYGKDLAPEGGIQQLGKELHRQVVERLQVVLN